MGLANREGDPLMIRGTDPASLEKDRMEAMRRVYRTDSGFLHIQGSDNGWDYSIYDEGLALIDGGIIEGLETIEEAALDIAKDRFCISGAVDPQWFEQSLLDLEETGTIGDVKRACGLIARAEALGLIISGGIIISAAA